MVEMSVSRFSHDSLCAYDPDAVNSLDNLISPPALKKFLLASALANVVLNSYVSPDHGLSFASYYCDEEILLASIDILELS